MAPNREPLKGRQALFFGAYDYAAQKHHRPAGSQATLCSRLDAKDLATKLQILGWDLDRVGVSKVESQLVWISDFEMLFLARVLKTEVPQLYPAEQAGRTFYENVMRWRGAE